MALPRCFCRKCTGCHRNRNCAEKLVKAVQRIIESQNKEGGLRYAGEGGRRYLRHDLPNHGLAGGEMQRGIFVPNETIEACVEYVKRSQNPDGGFMYMQNGGRLASPRSAAGVVCLYSAGVYEGDELKKGL